MEVVEKSKMRNAVIYIHGKGGSPDEAEHYKALFPQNDVFGLDYHAQTPWEAKREFPTLFHRVCEGYRSVVLIANSIGAFFAMNALYEENIERAFFISPVVNMEKLICNMMLWSNVTENDLREKKEIETDLGETLSWAYLCYVRENPLVWTVPTAILYGAKDNLTSYDTVSEFALEHGASLTVMRNGEHWFHKSSPDSCVKCYTMFLPFLLIKIDVFS